MRMNAAFFLALMLVLADVRAASAEAQGPQQHDRNPIVWLLSDLGKLLETSVSAVTHQTTKNDAAQQPVAKPDVAAEKPVVATASAEPVKTAETRPEKPSILSLFDDLARLFTPAKTDQAASRQADVTVVHQAPAVAETNASAPAATDVSKEAIATTDAPKEFRNPITWLLSDLSRLLQPTLEIDNQPARVAAVEEKPRQIEAKAQPDETPAPTPEAVTVQPEISSAPAEAPTLPTATQPHAKLLNPVEWLIRDLATLFTPSRSLTSVDETAHSANPEPANTFSAINEPQTSMAVAEPTIAPSPATDKIAANTHVTEVGPWVPRPKNNLFDPKDSLFGMASTPLVAQKIVAKPDAPTEMAAVRKQPVIRERLEDRPEIRNYGSLGYDPKTINKKADDDQGFIGNVLEQLLGTEPQIADKAIGDEPLASKIADTIVPEEKLDLGYISPDAKSPGLELTRIGEGPLTDIDLYLGNKVTIGAPYSAADYKQDACIERALHGSVFCLKSLNWPAEISKSFSTDTAYVMPGEGVVRYENGTSSRIYAVFNASDFAQVIKYMQHRFGPPQEREIGWMHMLEAPRMPNTTFRWQAFSPDRREIINLEVRNYDDLRRSFADMDHGMVRLYRSGSRPIFKHISTMDLMLMQRRRLASAPVEVNQPPKQQ